MNNNVKLHLNHALCTIINSNLRLRVDKIYAQLGYINYLYWHANWYCKEGKQIHEKATKSSSTRYKSRKQPSVSSIEKNKLLLPLSSENKNCIDKHNIGKLVHFLMFLFLVEQGRKFCCLTMNEGWCYPIVWSGTSHNCIWTKRCQLSEEKTILLKVIMYSKRFPLPCDADELSILGEHIDFSKLSFPNTVTKASAKFNGLDRVGDAIKTNSIDQEGVLEIVWLDMVMDCLSSVTLIIIMEDWPLQMPLLSWLMKPIFQTNKLSKG